MPMDGTADGTPENDEGPGLDPGPITCHFCWHPQRDSNPCRHLESLVTGPHGVLSSACAQVGDLLLFTKPC